MPVRVGLQGLKGLNEISDEERRKFFLDNADKLKRYGNPIQRDRAAEKLYNNQKFISTFGMDAFNQTVGMEGGYKYRNELLRDKLVSDAFNRNFHNDKNFRELSSELDTQGMYDLLTNQDYLGTQEIQKRLTEGIKASKRVAKSFNAAINNPYTDALIAGQTQIAKTQSAITPYQQAKKEEDKDKSIREKLFSETQKRRESEIQGLADSVYSGMVHANNIGQKSLGQFYNDFDKLATKLSPHYASFKNTEWLKDYTNKDRLQDYAKYQALKAKYGEGIAANYLERSMQDRVAKAQDGKWTGNTMKGVFTTMVSDLGSNVALFSNLGKSVDDFAIINQGKDPDNPIYDKKGHIVGYKDNDNIWTNPAYWNDVYKYNTTDPTEIKLIKERGGISPYVNVREYGYNPNEHFLSWDTAEEGFKQSGHILAGIAETALTGAAGKSLGWALKGGLKLAGLSGKALATASKVGNITNDILVTATTGLEGSQLEAMGTYEDQLQSNKERIQQQIENELHDYYKNLNLNSKESRQTINSYYQQLKAQDRRRMQLNRAEGKVSLPMSDKTLMDQARQYYTNQLLSVKQKQLEQLHKKDEERAAKDAAKAYTANFIMDYIKNIPLTTGIQRYKIAKGAMRGAFDNSISKNIVTDVENLGVKRAVDKAGNEIRNASLKGIAKEFVKQHAAGFADEYLDGINASFSKGIGDNEFSNYIDKTYNPKYYNAVADNMLGNLLSGVMEGTRGITDRENLYEGFIGMISPLVSVSVNGNMLFNYKDTKRALLQGKDANGNKLNLAERASRVIMNPLLDTYSNLMEKDRQTDYLVNAINNIVAANKGKVHDAAKILSTMDNPSTDLHEIRYNMENGEASPSLLDSKDSKLYDSFTLIDALNSLDNLEGGHNAKLYKDIMHTMEGLSNGTLSQDEMDNEVDQFLAGEDNKSILDDPNKRQIAAGRLQKNAQYFMAMKQKMQDIDDVFNRSSNLKDIDPRVKTMLKYNLVAEDDYKDRLGSIEKELSLPSTDANGIYAPNLSIRYGTKESRNNAISARERLIKEYQKEHDQITQAIEDSKEKVKSLKYDSRFTSDGDKKKEISDQIKQQKTIIASMEFHLKTLDEQQKMAQDEQGKLEELNNNPTETEFTENGILSLDARDRAAVLNPSNRDNYNAEQQKVIDFTRSNLERKDPNAMQKVSDAGRLAERIGDLKEVYSKILDNNVLASSYLDAKESLRDNAVIAESLQHDIEESYSKLEDAYQKKDMDTFKSLLLSTNSTVAKAYMEDHPEQADAVRPYYDILKAFDDAAVVIKSSDSPVEIKKAQLALLMANAQVSDNKEGFLSNIEKMIDDPNTPSEVKEATEDLMSRMEKMGYLRDSAILESRKERLQREAAEKKAREEKERRDKEAAEKAAKEAADKQAALDREKQQENAIHEQLKEDVKDASSDHPVNPNGEGVVSVDTSALRDIDTDNAEEVSVQPGIWDAAVSDFMSNDAENGIVNAGSMWYNIDGTPKKGDFRITLKNNDPSTGINASRTISFSIDGKEESLQVPSWDWEIEKGNDTMQETIDNEGLQDSPFYATNLYKDAKEWFMKGYFLKDGKKVSATVKASKTFDLSNEVERQKDSREAEASKKTDNLYNPSLYVDGDNIGGNSLTIEEQVNNANAHDNGIVVGEAQGNYNEGNNDDPTQGATGNYTNTVISGNAMSEYNFNELTQNKRMVHKKGTDNRKSMDEYFEWMRNYVDSNNVKGIKLQSIIDNELHNILSDDPHTKIKFMGVKIPVNEDINNDKVMQKHLMLVIDYNDKVKAIHHKENGGVIESSSENGIKKQYLIVGVAGYGHNDIEKRKLYNFIWDSYTPGGFNLKRKRKLYFDAHPEERFYVDPDLSTEIVPRSLTPGYIIKQLETDKSPEDRSLSELINNKERNPYNLDWNSIKIGIQEGNGFVIKKEESDIVSDKVNVPRNYEDNIGRVFILIEAGNGRYIPAYVHPLMYGEMRDGALKTRVEGYLDNVTSPVYSTRYDALLELCKIFHLNREGNNILLSRTRPIVSIVHDGKVANTFNLGDPNFKRQDFKDAFTHINPRVNVNLKVISNPDKIREYDEAGAFMTDCAMLGTVGSSFNIYGLDSAGNMIIPTVPNNQSNKQDNLDFRKGNNLVVYQGNYYSYDKGEDAFTLNGDIVKDDSLISQLKYNMEINERKLSAAKSAQRWNYYILDEGEYPIVVKRNEYTKEIVVPTEEKAKEFIDLIHKERDSAERDKQAETALKETKVEDVDLGLDGSISLDNEGSSVVSEEKKPTAASKEQHKEEETTHQETVKNNPVIDVYKGEGFNKSSDITSFSELIFSEKYGNEIYSIISQKWKDFPMDPAEAEEFLKKKNIQVDGITNTDEAIKAWIKTLKDCR